MASSRSACSSVRSFSAPAGRAQRSRRGIAPTIHTSGVALLGAGIAGGIVTRIVMYYASVPTSGSVALVGGIGRIALGRSRICRRCTGMASKKSRSRWSWLAASHRGFIAGAARRTRSSSLILSFMSRRNGDRFMRVQWRSPSRCRRWATARTMRRRRSDFSPRPCSWPAAGYRLRRRCGRSRSPRFRFYARDGRSAVCASRARSARGFLLDPPAACARLPIRRGIDA